jgi:lipoprotein-anchoring transpeptidase ErfK/SrfK
MKRGQGHSRLRAVAVAILVAAARAQALESARIVVSIPDRKLALVEGERVVKVYETAVGAAVSPSPTGSYTIATRIPNPTWYTPGKVVGPGKHNPLGTRWMGLSLKGFGIHGTNSPRSIGRAASHGCIRMRNRDVEELFERVSVGYVVELHGERDAEIERIFGAAREPATVVVAAADTPAPTGGE